MLYINPQSLPIEWISSSIRGDMILYHWKIFVTHHRLPSKWGTRQNGWTKEALLVKYRSRTVSCTEGGDCVKSRITVGISATRQVSAVRSVELRVSIPGFSILWGMKQEVHVVEERRRRGLRDHVVCRWHHSHVNIKPVRSTSTLEAPDVQGYAPTWKHMGTQWMRYLNIVSSFEYQLWIKWDLQTGVVIDCIPEVNDMAGL